MQKVQKKNDTNLNIAKIADINKIDMNAKKF